MKKLTSFFAILLFFSVLAAQEAQNEPAAAKETKESAETLKAEEPKPAENPAPEAKNEPVTTETTPEAAQESPVKEEKAAETEPKKEAEQEQETEKEAPETPAQPTETSAESVKSSETKEPLAEPNKPVETEKPECETSPKDEKPSKAFYQLSAGMGIGASLFSMRLNNDIDFLLKHTKNTNFYMGLEIDFRYAPYVGEDDDAIYEIPIQANMIFDFPLNNRNLSRIALWFSAGVDLAFGIYDWDDWDDRESQDTFKAMAAWGFGINMLFKNDVTLKLGFDSFYGKYPDIICAAGYRFY